MQGIYDINSFEMSYSRHIGTSVETKLSTDNNLQTFPAGSLE